MTSTSRGDLPTIRKAPPAASGMIWPVCPAHPGAPIQRQFIRGSQRSGVELRCSPLNGDQPHLLSSTESRKGAHLPAMLGEVTQTDCRLLADAAAGLTIAESATKRGMTIDLVKSRRRLLMVKLDTRNMTHAIAVAIYEGLISRPPRDDRPPR
jgi:DNA-binding CsgD family transcriptional regulator